jgi:nitrile hydratase subunit alpha
MSGDHHTAEVSGPAARAAALEALMKEKGLVSDEFIDRVVEMYTEQVGPRNGAKVVARAWTDPAYRERLLADGKSAIAELGFEGPEGDVVVVENTDEVHNVVVCTLCSCYPHDLLGDPPWWYRTDEYKQRIVEDPRTMLAEMLGLRLPPERTVKVHDSTSDVRWMVLPRRPAGAAGWSEVELAELVTPESLVGAGEALPPSTGAHDGQQA